ncbi:DUF155-domain-containing protein [Eremomyces bilateralis CBS 781.70]|uniref:DUF155-domain-containing protein n=1 Tax=Eremomyces bilateralis CBS 781.70 TaxID=1392243 RepID=A0A6G1FR56_9PEZI|nr:DUF155-domain-containing protein [Eremomyces bilateralis CBS 781.70]KAF1808257.1 DUF155-domain-containing protein [Eremomyces bilateralis CBS 781.70]
MASASESTPLLDDASSSTPSSSRHLPKPVRQVTFNPTVTSTSPNRHSTPLKPSLPLPSSHSTLPSRNGSAPLTSSASLMSGLNTKLRRRHSQGAVSGFPPHLSKIGPQRTTKTVQKLKILPDPQYGDEGPDEDSGRDVYAQYTRLKDPRSRRDAARLTKADKERLPRATAYCVAGKYKSDDVLRWLKSKGRTRGTMPKVFDECIYSPYSYSYGHSMSRSGGQSARTTRQYHSHEVGNLRGSMDSPRLVPQQERRHSDSTVEIDQPQIRERTDEMMDYGESGRDSVKDYQETRQYYDDTYSPSETPGDLDFDIDVPIPEVFIFDYGTVVIWGMTAAEEMRFLKELLKFEEEKIDKSQAQTEDFSFYYTREYQSRIYNDFISLSDKKNYMIKLTISHAMAQSVKTSYFEKLVDETIDASKELPNQIAETGKAKLGRKQLQMEIGKLFLLRINIHLQGSILDAPELMWSEPALDPLYQAVRGYLEMDQRVDLLMERVTVIGDLLSVLKDQLSHSYEELLEWIIIILIAAEIMVAAINIVVDLYAGGD